MTGVTSAVSVVGALITGRTPLNRGLACLSISIVRFWHWGDVTAIGTVRLRPPTTGAADVVMLTPDGGGPTEALTLPKPAAPPIDLRVSGTNEAVAKWGCGGDDAFDLEVLDTGIVTREVPL